MKHACIILLWICCFLLPLRPHADAAEPSPVTKRVLVLFGQEKGMPAQELIDQGMRAIFREQQSVRVQLFLEYLDLTRFSDSGYAKALAHFLRDKYHTHPPDLIITVFPTAYDFVKQNRDLFAQSPVVACTLPPEWAVSHQPSPQHDRMTGVIVVNISADIIRMALQLKPETKRMALVAGVSALDTYVEQFVLKGFAPFADRIELIRLVGLTLEETRQRVATLPADTVILYGGITRDGSGRAFTPDEAFNDIAQAANCPIFGFFDTHLGQGIVGGRLTSFDRQGRIAAGLALRILSGEATDAVPDAEDAGVITAFDWRQLRRWQIPERLIPAGATILYRNPTLWEEHRWQIIGVVALIMLQALLIAALLVQHRRRASAEVLVLQQKDQLAHLMRVSMMGELSASLAHELKQPLAAIRTNAQAALRFLDTTSPNLAEVRAILGDIISDNRRADEVIQRLRDLFSKRTTRLSKLDMNRLIREVVILITTEARHRGVTLDLHLAPTLPFITGDPVQLQQVVLNLIMNALESLETMPETSKRITIATATAADAEVLVTVADTGPGLPEGDPEKLFTPFTTTKPTGMGMGLTLSRAIIEAHGGALTACPAPGGAIFTCALPATHSESR